MKKFSESMLRILFMVVPICVLLFYQTQGVKSIYDEIHSGNITSYMCLDGIVRNLHYSIPHKPFEMLAKSDGSGRLIPFCPECADALREMGLFKEPGTWIETTRLNELLEKEQQLAEVLRPIPMDETHKCLDK